MLWYSNGTDNNNTQLLSCHVSTDTVKTVAVESQALCDSGPESYTVGGP